MIRRWSDESPTTSGVRTWAEIKVEFGLRPRHNQTIIIPIEMWDRAWAFVSQSHNERGGLFVGKAYNTPEGQPVTVVTNVLPAPATRASGVHLQFTGETWEQLAPVIGSREVVVGWFHSHPGLGVFLSSTDRTTQGSFFRQPWQFGVVFDPDRGEAGTFIGEEGTRRDDFLALVHVQRSITTANPQATALPASSTPVTRARAALALGNGRQFMPILTMVFASLLVVWLTRGILSRQTRLFFRR